MRCSICDRSDTRFIYNNWHCPACEDSIRQAIGDIHEEDVINMFDDDSNVELSVDTNDYSILEDTED